MSSNNIIGVLVLAGATALAGCAASQTEREFGQAVRHTMAQQRVTPAPAQDTEAGADGQRLESVISVYRTRIGDPGTVVGGTMVDPDQGSR